jgi:hypothetical protein
MDFDLSEDQSLLLASCERLVRSRCTFEARRRHVLADPSAPTPVWGELVSLGLAALHVPEAAGGLGLPALDGVLVARELGRGWLIDPFVDSALAAPALLAALPVSAARDELLARIAGGEIAIALRGAKVESGDVRAAVAHAGYAQSLLAIAGDRLLCFDAARVEREPYRQLDGSAAASVRAPVSAGIVLAEGDAARAAWRAGSTMARIGRIGEGVGMARTVIDLTADYLRTRKQFGQPIGRFQVLAHRMADLLILLEQMQSLALAAAMRSGESKRGESKRDEDTIDAAQFMTHRALRRIGQEAIQMHGGIGMADESAVSHYVKRMLAIEFELSIEAGDADGVLARYAARH